MTRGPAGVRFDEVLWRIACVVVAIGLLYGMAALTAAGRERFDWGLLIVGRIVGVLGFGVVLSVLALVLER